MKKKYYDEDKRFQLLAPYPAPLKKQDKIVNRVEIFANILKTILATIIFVFTTNPIYLFFKSIKQYFLLKKWRARKNAIAKKDLIPPQQNAVYVANDTQTMDQNFFYILKNGRIWFKPIAASLKSHWELFGPDGLPAANVKLNSISTDGDNIIAIGDSGKVHYGHTHKIRIHVTDRNWKLRHIETDWRDAWLAIPLINKIINKIKGKHLILPNNIISAKISQKGPETAYYVDMNGNKHPEFLVGVTTLYTLCDNGRIFFADPWLANKFANEITGPEDGQFVAEKMAAAASTLFLAKRDAVGKLIMYTRFADYDSLGSDPVLPATYNSDTNIALVRHLPGENWLKQPEIILHAKAQITGNISILQTGRGQTNRQLRVEGTNAEGCAGYYFKSIYEKDWSFESTPSTILTFSLSPNLKNPPSPPSDFTGRAISKKSNGIESVAVKKFLRHGLNERGLNTVVELNLDNGRQLVLPLHASRGWLHFFGRKQYAPKWQLVMPKLYETDNDPKIKNIKKLLFKNKNNISVAVNELTDGSLTIFTHKIKMQLQEVKANDVKVIHFPYENEQQLNKIWISK